MGTDAQIAGTMATSGRTDSVCVDVPTLEARAEDGGARRRADLSGASVWFKYGYHARSPNVRRIIYRNLYHCPY